MGSFQAKDDPANKKAKPNDNVNEILYQQLKNYAANLENDKLDIKKLQKKIENSKEMNHEDMIKKLTNLQEVLLSGNNDDNISLLLSEIFRLERESNKAFQSIEEQERETANNNELDLDYEDLYLLMKSNGLL